MSGEKCFKEGRKNVGLHEKKMKSTWEGEKLWGGTTERSEEKI